MQQARQAAPAPDGVEQGMVRVTNRAGKSPFLLICDHASNWLPADFGTLGLMKADMLRHIAWDPGALPVALKLADALDATLIAAGVSRLAIDCNRPLNAPDLIPQISETTLIPGNAALTEKQRAERIALSWQPFHETVEELVNRRLARRPRDVAGDDPFLYADLQGRGPAVADRHPARRRRAPVRAADRGAQARRQPDRGRQPTLFARRSRVFHA